MGHWGLQDNQRRVGIVSSDLDAAQNAGDLMGKGFSVRSISKGEEYQSRDFWGNATRPEIHGTTDNTEHPHAFGEDF